MNRTLVVGVWIVTLALLAALPARANEEGPLVHWTFDDVKDAVVPDASGHKSDGRLVGPEGSVVVVAEGRKGSALKFSTGTEKGGAVALDQFPKLDLSQGFTLEVWARSEGITSWKSSVKRAEIMATGADTSPGFHFCIAYGSVRLVGTLADGQRKTLAAHNPATKPLSVNEWHHLAVTCDQKICKVYIDGEEAASGELPAAIAAPRHPLSVGAYDYGTAYRFPGMLDELTIYNYVRTGVQIAQDARIE